MKYLTYSPVSHYRVCPLGQFGFWQGVGSISNLGGTGFYEYSKPSQHHGLSDPWKGFMEDSMNLHRDFDGAINYVEGAENIPVRRIGSSCPISLSWSFPTTEEVEV